MAASRLHVSGNGAGSHAALPRSPASPDNRAPTPMKIELDTEKLLAMLEAWRSATDLQAPMMDQFKI